MSGNLDFEMFSLENFTIYVLFVNQVLIHGNFFEAFLFIIYLYN